MELWGWGWGWGWSWGCPTNLYLGPLCAVWRGRARGSHLEEDLGGAGVDVAGEDELHLPVESVHVLARETEEGRDVKYRSAYPWDY